MKKQEDFVGLSRSPLVNQLHALKEALTGRPPKYNMHGMVRQNVFQWFWKNLLHLGNTHYPYQTYQNLAQNNGIFRMNDAQPVSVALLADWASDTPESHNVAALCGSEARDFTVHLGDTYYVGNEKEIACNFNSTFGAPWPYGKAGSFALLGNHEMYSSGKSFFTQLLPYMTVCEGGEVKQQEASFFCLENDDWRIIGLDTGYYSLKGFLGIASNTNLKLPDAQMQWLHDVVQPDKDDRGIIFLSHHQPFSAFDKEAFVNPGKQLCEVLGNRPRTMLWFWGHEHRLSLYGENTIEGGQKVFGRCIGHGGMPVEIDVAPKPDARNLVLFDRRERKRIDGKYPVGYNGYVVLNFDGPELRVAYYDDNENNDLLQQRKVLEEKWVMENGRLRGVSIEDYTADKLKKLTQVQDLEKAIDKVERKEEVKAV